MRLIEGIEATDLVRLPPEQLYDAHAADALTNEGVQARQARANIPISGAHRILKQPRRDQDQRNDHEGGHSQLPVDGEHHDADGEQREEIAHPSHHPGGEQLVERLDVAGHPGDQSPHRVAVEVGDREALQPFEQFPAQIAHHPLPKQ